MSLRQSKLKKAIQGNPNPETLPCAKKYKGQKHFNEVDGKSVPIPHFGVVLKWNDFKCFSSNLMKKNIKFQIPPYLRFKDQPGEQMTMFFYDPSGNALEFKSFKNMEQIFAK